ncbi:MAG: type II secretion system protein [Phycisphaerales bacterium]
MNSKGISFIEILLVVIILGIVSAILIPQYSAASEDATLAYMIYDMQNMRWQIQKYKNEHNGMMPTANGHSFVDSMTKYTYADGSIAKEQKSGKGVLGPYLNEMPENPFVREEDGAVVKCGPETPEADGTSGWFFNTKTGAFNANDNSSHSAL